MNHSEPVLRRVFLGLLKIAIFERSGSFGPDKYVSISLVQPPTVVAKGCLWGPRFTYNKKRLPGGDEEVAFLGCFRILTWMSMEVIVTILITYLRDVSNLLF